MKRNYEDVLRHVKGVLQGEPDLIANLSNVAAILKTMPQYYWVGFYRVVGDELVLGPFQGPVACTRIKRGKGVCGQAWDTNQSMLVDDVHAFPGHIACDPNSKSEVVVPVCDSEGNVTMVLDVDSDDISAFSEADVEALESVAKMLSTQNFTL